MAKNCCVQGCDSESYANCGISFHSFPKDELLRAKWVNALGCEITSKNPTVCSRHFKKENFRPTVLPTLKKDAVPIVVDLHISCTGRGDQFGDNLNVDELSTSYGVTASTSATTSQQRDAIKKRKGSLPEAKTIIKSVFSYLQTEYENLKNYTGGSCDLSPLENILARTAAATGVSEEEVTAIFEEGDSDDSSDESSSKRARVSRDNYDENISPIEEDSSAENADEAQPDNRESTIEIEENPIETLKVEIDENVEYHSKPNTGILFQIPFSREQMSVLHQSLSLTVPTHVEVKQEPADVEEQQQMSIFHQSSLTEPTHAEVKQEPTDVEEQQRLNQLEISTDVEDTGGEQDPLGDTEYPSSPTAQVGRRPD